LEEGLKILPEHIKIYLSEKSNKYLGVEYDDINHLKLFDILHGTLLVEDIEKLLESFRPLWSKISDRCFIKREDSPIPEFQGTFTVIGVDYSITRDIKSYLESYSVDELKSLMRDIKLSSILE
jgi:hypothetical protein